MKPTDPAQAGETKEGADASADASVEATPRDADVTKAQAEPEVKAQEPALSSSAETQKIDSPQTLLKRAAKAYTFFTTAAPRAAPLLGEQLVNCVCCGKQQRVPDKFCASCGHQRA